MARSNVCEALLGIVKEYQVNAAFKRMVAGKVLGIDECDTVRVIIGPYFLGACLHLIGPFRQAGPPL